MDQAGVRFAAGPAVGILDSAMMPTLFHVVGDVTVAPLVQWRSMLSQLSTRSGHICDIGLP
jgi:hypothetical protein